VEYVIKIQNILINAATTTKTKMTKPQANTFSKYCEDNPKNKSLI